MDNELCAKKDPRSIRLLVTEINSLKVANELQISRKMLPGAEMVVHIGCKFASKNENHELVRPFVDVLRFQNHLQSSCSMSFVARSDQFLAQLRLSFEIG